MKRKFFVISVIIVISLVTMAGFIVNAVSKSSVVFTPMGIAKNRALWDQFKENAKAGKADQIKLKLEIDFVISEVSLVFDGEKYRYIDDLLQSKYTYSNDSSQSEYKYLLELQGTMPNAAKESYFIILANEPYSFDEFSLSLYSSFSDEANLDYKFIYTW